MVQVRDSKGRRYINQGSRTVCDGTRAREVGVVNFFFFLGISALRDPELVRPVTRLGRSRMDGSGKGEKGAVPF